MIETSKQLLPLQNMDPYSIFKNLRKEEDYEQVENYEQVEACSMHIYIYMQLVPIITKVVSLNRAHGEVH